MAIKRSIKIALSYQRMEALNEICEEMIDDFKPANEHQNLLYAFLLELRHRITQLLKNNQANYFLTFLSMEAIAFYQLWHIMDIRHDKYAALIVDAIMKKLSSLT